MKRFLILIFLSLTISSCTHYYYYPSTKNVPLLKSKNDFNISLISSSGSYTSAIEFQGAYAFTDNIAAMSSFMYAEGGNKANHNYGKGNYFDAAIGYYKPILKYGVIEIYTGYGNSFQSHLYDAYSSNYPNRFEKAKSNLSFNKLFVQPSFGLKGKIAEIAFTTGLSSVNFYNVNHNIDVNELEYEQIQNIAKFKRALLFENALTFRLGWKFIKFQFQLQSSEQLSSPTLQFGQLSVGFGLNFAINREFVKPLFR